MNTEAFADCYSGDKHETTIDCRMRYGAITAPSTCNWNDIRIYVLSRPNLTFLWLLKYRFYQMFFCHDFAVSVEFYVRFLGLLSPLITS